MLDERKVLSLFFKQQIANYKRSSLSRTCRSRVATSLITWNCVLCEAKFLVRFPARNHITPISITVYSVYPPNVSVFMHHARGRQ